MNKIKPEAWIHGTDGQISEKRGWEDWKRLAKEHIRVYAKPMDTDYNVVKAGVGGRQRLGGTGKEGKWRASINSVNNF